jgi:small subunit ribosomal protein S6
MNKYELTIVLDGKATPAKRKSVRASVEKVISSLKGKIGTVEDWGERPLAYKIGKAEAGNLLFFPLELDANAAKALPARLKQQEEVLRYLFLRKD